MNVKYPLLLVTFMLALFSGCSSSSEAPGSSPTPAGTPLSRESAPAFSLPDQDGATYDFRPGDGKARILVFYMGYF
jgi:cytochrome oxidase Cu insertion factor (SCO1/SenC/PrrC family)